MKLGVHHRRRRSRRGLGRADGQASTNFWKGKQLLEAAKVQACPQSSELADRARVQALLAKGAFSAAGDTRGAASADDLARAAFRVIVACQRSKRLSGARRRRRK